MLAADSRRNPSVNEECRTKHSSKGVKGGMLVLCKTTTAALRRSSRIDERVGRDRRRKPERARETRSKTIKKMREAQASSGVGHFIAGSYKWEER